MKRAHLTDNDFIQTLYGVGEHEAHLQSCSACHERFLQMRQKRSDSVLEVEASSDFLAAQRRKIYQRLGQPQSGRLHWAPALAAAVVLLVAGFLAYRPNVTAPAHPNGNDTQVFSEAYSIEQNAEPGAMAPIHALFEHEHSEE